MCNIAGLAGLLPESTDPIRTSISQASPGLALPLLLFSVDSRTLRHVLDVFANMYRGGGGDLYLAESGKQPQPERLMATYQQTITSRDYTPSSWDR